MNFITSILIVCLLGIAYYDFRYMAVPWILLLFSLLLALARFFIVNSHSDNWIFIVINLSGVILFTTLSILILYTLKRKIFNPVNTLIGVGDLMFFPIVCLFFSPLNFIVFIIFSLGILLILKPLLFRINRGMPLAGGLALISCIFIISSILTGYNLFADALLINILM